jgi:hypothetical protein
MQIVKISSCARKFINWQNLELWNLLSQALNVIALVFCFKPGVDVYIDLSHCVLR